MRSRRSHWVALSGLLSLQALAEPIDNCASLLGSISVELRVARALPPSTPTTFTCPRETNSLLGASQQRIVNALGTPDVSDHGASGSSAASWSYFFTGARAGERGAGIPELTFDFDDHLLVSSISCQRTR